MNGYVGACSTYGGEQSCIQGFWLGDLMERGHLEDPGLDGMVMLDVVWEGMDCIDQ
jgi:hypothetical protein